MNPYSVFNLNGESQRVVAEFAARSFTVPELSPQ
jgi:hypothetical protein